MRHKGKFLFLSLSFTGIFLVAAWGAGLYAFTRSVSQSAFEIPDRKTDALVVLTGGRDRLAEGFDLLEKQYAEKLFISGVYQGVEVNKLLSLWKDSPTDMDCCITLGYSASNTIGNARETAEWMTKESLRSLRLVTANYHIPRARLEFEDALPGVDIIYHPVTPEGYDIEKWWNNWQAATLTLKEYTKFIVAFARIRFLRRLHPARG